MNKVQTWRSLLLGTSMVLGPVLILIGHLITVPADENPDAYIPDVANSGAVFVLSAVLIAVGAALLIVNAAGFLRLTPSRGGTLTTIGSIALGVAAIGLSGGNLMFGAVMGSLASGDQALARQALDVIGSSTEGGLPFVLAPLLPLGLVLIAIGLIIARTVPLWLAIVLGVGGILFFVSGAGGLLTFALLLPMAVGIAGCGVVIVLRASRPGNAATASGTPAEA